MISRIGLSLESLTMALLVCSSAAWAEPTQFVVRRDQLSHCLDRYAQANLSQYADQAGGGDRLARRLFRAAVHECRIEVEQFRRITNAKQFREELSHQSDQIVRYYSNRIEAERDSAI